MANGATRVVPVVVQKQTLRSGLCVTSGTRLLRLHLLLPTTRQLVQVVALFVSCHQLRSCSILNPLRIDIPIAVCTRSLRLWLSVTLLSHFSLLVCHFVDEAVDVGHDFRLSGVQLCRTLSRE